MKKISILLCAMIAGTTTFAQSFVNAGMDTWRNNTAGTSSVAIHAPTQWYGFDSLAISLGESFGTLIGASSNFHAQLYQESSIIHGVPYSAKVMTLKQDTIGIVAGSLANSVAHLNVAAILAVVTTGGTITSSLIASATSFTGGTGVTQRITSVSAWVEYHPGVDTGGHPGLDTALLTVQALGHKVGRSDTLVGGGTIQILPSTSFTQITAPITYLDTVNYYIDTIRVVFSSSSGGRSRACDSSTLYVDDVSMTGVANPDFSGVRNVTIDNAVRVYPNPAKDVLYIETSQPGEAEFTLYSVTGKAVANKRVSWHDELNVSSLPSGVYFYTMRDGSGNATQNGKITLSK